METRAGTKNTNSKLLTLETGALAMKEPVIDWISIYKLIPDPAFDKSGLCPNDNFLESSSDNEGGDIYDLNNPAAVINIYLQK
jgi:hypothetical protein